MSFYESELQKMICGIPFIQSHTLAGKSILGKLDRDLRVKISFVQPFFLCLLYLRVMI